MCYVASPLYFRQEFPLCCVSLICTSPEMNFQTGYLNLSCYFWVLQQAFFNLLFYHINKDNCLTKIRKISIFYFVCPHLHNNLSSQKVMIIRSICIRVGSKVFQPLGHFPCAGMIYPWGSSWSLFLPLTAQAGTVSSSICSGQGKSQHRKMSPKVINFWWRWISLIPRYEPHHLVLFFKFPLLLFFHFFFTPSHFSVFRARQQSNFLLHRKFQHFKTCFSSVLDITSFHIKH